MSGLGRVLAVEDDAALRALYVSALRDAVDVVEASTVATALSALGKLTRRDFVLTDHFLPDGSGLMVLERAAQVGISGLLVTGAPGDLVRQAGRLGALVLAKPMPLDWLRACVVHGLARAAFCAAEGG